MLDEACIPNTYISRSQAVDFFKSEAPEVSSVVAAVVPAIGSVTQAIAAGLPTALPSNLAEVASSIANSVPTSLPPMKTPSGASVSFIHFGAMGAFLLALLAML
jgi:hypothetical protein